MEAGLALGSNIGDRLNHLRAARERICAVTGVSLVEQSPVYETEPVGVPDEFGHMAFLNCILIVGVSVAVGRLAVLLRDVEREMGRRRALRRNAPRTIDIDIIYAGRLQVKTEHIEIPHPRWFLRRFVVQPLNDVRAHLRVPGRPGTVSDVLDGLADGSKVKLFADLW